MKKVRFAVLFIFAGVIMIAAGMFLGGDEDVLQKAIRVCLECIGIG